MAGQCFKMDLNAYLHRVGIKDRKPPSLEALRELHYQHVTSVPFESLSIHTGEKIILNPALIYDKIVVRRRGGFCFENNGLFLWVLRESGYDPKILSARVRNPKTGIFGPPYDHMILTVELEGRRWLCDVGFGDGLTYPFPLEAGWEEQQENRKYRLHVDGEQWNLELKEDGDWKTLFKFTLEERRYEEFKEMCVYHQTSPISLFYCKSFCSLQLPRGRVTYIGHRLIRTQFTEAGISVKTTQDLTEDEIPALLRDQFGIVLSGKLVIKDEELLPPPSE